MSFGDDFPIPESAGEQPPAQDPFKAGAPSPSPRPPIVVRKHVPYWPPLLARVEEAVTAALDLLDAAGDAVAERLGLRRAGGGKAGGPPPAT
jgi:hypothetical protein